MTLVKSSYLNVDLDVFQPDPHELCVNLEDPVAGCDKLELESQFKYFIENLDHLFT